MDKTDAYVQKLAEEWVCHTMLGLLGRLLDPKETKTPEDALDLVNMILDRFEFMRDHLDWVGTPKEAEIRGYLADIEAVVLAKYKRLHKALARKDV